MKTGIASLGVLAGLVLVVCARELKSADGSQTINGEFIRYDLRNDKVTIRLADGNNMVAPANKFSENDVSSFKEQQKIEDQKDAIKVSIRAKSDNDSEKRGNMRYKVRESTVNFTIKNSSDYAFSDLKLQYWTAVERNNKGAKSTELLTGSETISILEANGETVVEGPKVRLIQGAASECKTGCPKVAAAAAKVGDERILGTKIEITNKAGDVLFSDGGSNRVKTLMNKK